MEEGHSLDHGHKTDIVSGFPAENETESTQEKQLAKLRDRQAKHEATLSDLQSEKGQRVIEKVHEALDNRVMELVKEDETARALMSVLESFGAEIVATRAIRQQVESLHRLLDRQ